VSPNAAELKAAEAQARSRSLFASGLLLGISLVLIALNMRDLTTSVAAVLPEITRDLGLSPAQVSILTAVPVLCFGLFGPAGAILAQRLGIGRALLLALIVLTGGTAIRVLGTTLPLFAGQLLSGAAIGVLNVLLPALLKRDFPQHIGLMTGLYTMATCLGAAIPAAATVPLMHAWGSWFAALGFWALPAAAATLVWFVVMNTRPSDHAAPVFSVRGLWRDGLAWQVAAFMGLQSSFAYIIFGWLSPILRERGISATHAGISLAACVVAQAVGSLVSPAIAMRSRDQRLSNVAVAVLLAAGLLGCIFAPVPTVLFWALLAGFCQGAIFALAITVIVLRSPSVEVATHLSGMSQTIGYMIAWLGPLLAGLLRGWTGSWNAPAVLFLTLGAATAFFGAVSGRSLHVGATVTYATPPASAP
jgi:MFS transporter, CP family, cyanate transporter